MLRFALIFLTLLMSIGVNLDDGFLVRLGVDPDILMAALTAFVIAGLILHHRLALIVLVVLLTLGANVPAEYAASWGYDPDYLLGALVAIVVSPWIGRWL